MSLPTQQWASNVTQFESGPEVIKLFSCSTQLSMQFFLLINVKMPTTVGVLTFMSGKDSIFDKSSDLAKTILQGADKFKR